MYCFTLETNILYLKIKTYIRGFVQMLQYLFYCYVERKRPAGLLTRGDGVIVC